MRKRMIAALLCLAFALPAWGWSWGALCGKGSADEVAAMIKKDANVNAADKNGETALFKACNNSRVTPETIEVLLAAGADARAKTKRGETALDKARKNRKLPPELIAKLEAAAK